MTYRRTPPRPRRRPGAPARRHQWTPAAVERKRAAARRQAEREYAEVRAWWAGQDWHAIAARARAQGLEFSRLYADLEARCREVAATIGAAFAAALAGRRLEYDLTPALEPARGRRPDLVLVDDLPCPAAPPDGPDEGDTRCTLPAGHEGPHRFPPEILEESLKLGPGPADE